MDESFYASYPRPRDNRTKNVDGQEARALRHTSRVLEKAGMQIPPQFNLTRIMDAMPAGF
jgi:hypothetical protein